MRLAVQRASFTPSPKAAAIAVVVVYAGLSLATLKLALASNSLSWSVVAFAIPLLPFALGASLRAPLIFPFTIYAASIPFENLVTVGALGSVPRLLAMACTGAILARIVVTKDIRVPGRSVFVWGLLILLMAASIMWADNKQAAIDWFSSYAQLYLLLVVVAMTPVTWTDIRAVMIAVVIGGICGALYGDYLIGQGGSAYRHDRLIVEAGDRRVDPNTFAESLILPLALSLIYFLRLRFGVEKIVAFVAVGILVGGFIASGSRGGLLASAALIGYLLWRSPYRIQLGTFVLSAGTAILASPYVARFAVAVSSGGAGRTSIWKTAYVAFRKHWLIGVGIGNFQDAYDRAWFQVNHGDYKLWHIVAHNVIAQTGVELGIVGLALLLCAWFLQFRALSGTSAPGPYADVRAAIEGSVLAMFVASMFLDLMHQKASWCVFILGSLALAYARSVSGAGDAENRQTPALARVCDPMGVPRAI